MKSKVLLRTAVVLAGTVGMLVPAFVSNAEILEDSNVGITYALDEYLESLEVRELKEAEKKEEAPTCQYPEFEGKCLASAVLTLENNLNLIFAYLCRN